jgi:hypothetical protein
VNCSQQERPEYHFLRYQHIGGGPPETLNLLNCSQVTGKPEVNFSIADHSVLDCVLILIL